ncbi:hypothetical protein IRY55_02590 [Savagea sp. SN6]|uniref:Uncharacterized protein n=1 Tax=Savagea serpentis TaxID=2785297 RepID=A0A8J7KKN5_9BACL|nr:peptidase G2 autoproteolytic cleavage domain-containing protein [Savagea serpentis]MBF4500239.1 hypothetical protein [Savagea serpentis]
MKQLRKTGNPLDASTRNDINYNWDIINKVMADLSTSEQETVNQFLAVKGDIDKLNKKDAELMQMILSNTNLIEAMDLDLIKEQGDIAEQKGNTAKRQGDKAQSQGDKAEQQGNTAEQQGNEVVAIGAAVTKQGEYAKEQGDYAKEKAELAQDKITEITQAHNDLDALKVDAIKATQNANTQADNAKVEAENAKKQADYTQSIGDTVANKLDDIESVKQDVISKGETTQAQGLKAKEQGDYAQSVIDSYKHVGEWQGSVEYKKNQEVLYNGSTYRAIEDNKGTQPTDKSKWQLIAQRGVDGEGAVGSVNGIMPDSDGNVNLGDIADKQYVDNKISEIPEVDLSALETKTDATAKLKEAKEYTDTQISAIPEVDLTPLETKEDAQAKLTEAKQYTDEKIGDVDLSALETKEDATAKLKEAKSYTDTKTTNMETTTGAQSKATKALEDSKIYTDTKVSEIPVIDTSQFVTTEHVTQDNVTTENNGTAFGKDTVAQYTGSFAAGSGSVASGDSAVALGQNCESTRDYTFSAGHYSKATGAYSIALGRSATAEKISSISIGHGAKTLGESSVSIGQGAATGETSISIGGTYSKANGKNSVAIGVGSSSSGIESVAIGRGFSEGNLTVAIGNRVIASVPSSLALGQFNVDNVDTNKMLVFGLGANTSSRLNGMVITKSGDMHLLGQYKTGGADYAEMFEWEDKNPENIDRVALAVTWGEGESIKLANSGDEIIGVVSATAAILGDNPDEWDKRFVTDQFGRPLRKEYTEINEDGEEETYEWFVENPEYDKNASYTPRSERPEWDAVGLMGKLYWIDDGTLEVGDYATVGSNGVATKGDKSNGWRVMKRISKNVDGNSGVVKVFFK